MKVIWEWNFLESLAAIGLFILAAFIVLKLLALLVGWLIFRRA